MLFRTEYGWVAAMKTATANVLLENLSPSLLSKYGYIKRLAWKLPVFPASKIPLTQDKSVHLIGQWGYQISRLP
jgi:hypothetical protein